MVFNNLNKELTQLSTSQILIAIPFQVSKHVQLSVTSVQRSVNFLNVQRSQCIQQGPPFEVAAKCFNAIHRRRTVNIEESHLGDLGYESPSGYWKLFIINK